MKNSSIKGKITYQYLMLTKSLIVCSLIWLHPVSAEEVTHEQTDKTHQKGSRDETTETQFLSHKIFTEGLRVGTPVHQLRLGIFTQGYARVLEENDQTKTSLNLQRIRPALELSKTRGGKQQRLLLQLELLNPSPILDAEYEIRWSQGCALLLGRYRPLSSRSLRVGLPVLSTPTRGKVSDEFTDPRMNGVTLMGQPLSGVLEYAIGVLDAAGYDPKLDRDLNLTGRLSFNPFGATPYTQIPWYGGVSSLKMSLGLNTTRQLNPAKTKDPRVKYSTDFSVLHPRFLFTGEIFNHDRDDGTTRRGGYAQLGTPLLERLLDLGARYGEAWTPTKAGKREDKIQSLELMVSVYGSGVHRRLMLGYEWLGAAYKTESHQLTLIGQFLAW